MFSGSVDADFVLALPFHHGDLEPDCVGVSMGGGLIRGIKIPPQDFPLKMQGGAYVRGGGGVFAGHNGATKNLRVKIHTYLAQKEKDSVV